MADEGQQCLRIVVDIRRGALERARQFALQSHPSPASGHRRRIARRTTGDFGAPPGGTEHGTFSLTRFAHRAGDAVGGDAARRRPALRPWHTDRRQEAAAARAVFDAIAATADG